ncbi:MAG: hypothetical protein IIW20_05060 [Clostridia bacterium]|nr:hypothetical protein [Clostridia bacterium]
MCEKILTDRKNGMLALLLTVALLVLSLVGVIFGGIMLDADDTNPVAIALFAISMIIFCFGWIPFMGLRVLKPQEALVVTLFGKYVGTLKGEDALGVLELHCFQF